MNKHEANKILLEKFTLDQLHDLCKEYKREMNTRDYIDSVVFGEINPEIIKKRFIPHIVGFFNQSEIMEFARKFCIKIY